MFSYLYSLGFLGIIIIFFIVFILLILVFPYCYVIARLISKAWHKSKNEENKHYGQ